MVDMKGVRMLCATLTHSDTINTDTDIHTYVQVMHITTYKNKINVQE